MASFSFVDIGGRRYGHDRDPEECPICHVAIQPEERDWGVISSPEGPRCILEIVFQCPRSTCRHFFVARDNRSDIDIPTTASGIGHGLREFVFYESVPATPPTPQLPAEVTQVSPSFVEIYGQAEAAGAFGLQQVAGVGYRKALEFLIKDYCITINPAAESAIRCAYLDACINQFVDSPQVKVCAERAAWLGNDETHYERRWDDYDIRNLKELILLTVNWIHSDILTRKYKSDIQ